MLLWTETLLIAANQARYVQADALLINTSVSTTTACDVHLCTDHEILWEYYN